MTQPSTSDSDQLSAAPLAPGKSAQTSASEDTQGQPMLKPALRHPNFDPNRTPIDPARPLSDIPDPVPNYDGQLQRLYAQDTQDRFSNARQLREGFTSRHKRASAGLSLSDNASKWELVESQALAEHLALLSAARLIELPDSFYHNHSAQPLLKALTTMPLLDMSDIATAMRTYPNLTRYGMSADGLSQSAKHFEHTYHLRAKESKSLLGAKTLSSKPSQNKNSTDQSAEHSIATVSQALADEIYGDDSISRQIGFDSDELLNSDYADDWEVILYPERFDGPSSSSAGSLATDIIACSLAVFVMRQCDTRKTINTRYSVNDICHYMRSYLLSQVRLRPTHDQLLRQVRLFAGHVIVAAHYLGWESQVEADGEVYFNISSRCSLLSRYPNITEYYINGWSSNID